MTISLIREILKVEEDGDKNRDILDEKNMNMNMNMNMNNNMKKKDA